MANLTIEQILAQSVQSSFGAVGEDGSIYFLLPGDDEITRARRGLAPSRPITVLGFPAPGNTTVVFTYNRYVEDEYENENPELDIPTNLENSDLFLGGDIPVNVLVDAGSEGQQFIAESDVQTYAPRTNFISWTQSTPLNMIPEAEFPTLAETADAEELIREAMGSFVTGIPDDVSLGHVSQSTSFAAVQLQDSNFVEQIGGLYDAVLSPNRFYAYMVANHSLGMGFDPADFAPIFPIWAKELEAGQAAAHTPGINTAGTDLKEGALALDAASTAVVQGLVQNDSWEFGTAEGVNTTAGDNVRNLGLVETYVQINHRILGQVIRAASSMPHTFTTDYSTDLDYAYEIEESVSSVDPGMIINENEYELLVMDVRREISDSPGPAKLAHVVPYGYIVEKFRVEADKKVQMSSLVVGDPRVTTVADTKIKVGATYAYRVRAVVGMSFETAETSDLDGQFFEVFALFSSVPSPFTIVTTGVQGAPKPPVDLRFIYDYKDDALIFTWNFPVEREQDIKYFQVLRRKSIFEPYQLIAFYNFNDSVEPVQISENINLNELEEIQLRVDSTGAKKPDPKTMFVDHEFNKDSTFIYTMASVDAHGNISNYAGQFLVFFDRLTNKIEVRSISSPEAPRAYPNMFLKQDESGRLARANSLVDGPRGSGENQIVHDLVKVSGKRNMRIYLNPAAMKVDVGNGSVKDIVKIAKSPTPFSPGGYRAAIYNIDNSATQLLNIDIEDVDFLTDV